MQIFSQKRWPAQPSWREFDDFALDAFISDPTLLLNEPYRRRLEAAQCMHRVVCDYIAGMTDVFAARFHQRLFGSRQGSVFEKL
ncbi:MAG: hypothetical protein FJ271_31045 [Planctomycetes bacterium]|nr:hypothetical protein [Planctomycetota bacterium]